MPDLVVTGANLHNSKGAVRYLRRRSVIDHPEHFDIAGTYEGHRRYRMLKGAPGADYRTGDHAGPSRETGILVGRHLTDLGGGSEFISPASERFESVGKERWGQDRVVELGAIEVAAIVYHPVAGPSALRGTNPDHPLVRRYAKGTRWLEDKITYHTGRGRECVVIADIQVPATNDRPWAPRHVFLEHDMGWIWHGIDVIAHTKGLEPVGNPAKRVIQGVLPDHPLIRVEFDIATNKRRNR